MIPLALLRSYVEFPQKW